MNKDEPYTAQFALIRKRKIPLIQAGSMGVSMPQPEAGDVGRVLTVKSDLSLDWEPPSGGGGAVLVASVTISNSELRSTTPITVVAAPGADKVIICSNYTIVHNYGGSNVWTALGTFTLGYDSPQVGGVAMAVPTLSASSSQIRSAPFTLAANLALSSVIDKALTLRVGTPGTGNAANNNTVTVFAEYYVIDV